MKSSKTSQRFLLIMAAFVLFILIGVITLIGNPNRPCTKVGLILTGTISDHGWNGMHYQGVSYACDKLGAELLVKENVPEDTDSCAEAIQELISDGASMIILSSYAYPMIVEEVIQDYPEIAFYAISAECYSDNITSYFGRMYQARYLTGVIAGMQTENNNIGYVAAMPNIEVNRGINAFTLGVRSVNPDAVVNVVWTNSWENKEKEVSATYALIEEKQVDVVTYHQNQHYVAITADEAGIYSIGYNEEVEGLSDKYLSAAVWNWQKLYYKIIREHIMGASNTIEHHWFGINTGVVDLAEYSPLITEEVRQRVASAKQDILAGKDVFSGVIYDTNGELRCDEEESISDEVLLEKMDWYVDGVVIYEQKDEQ